MTGKPIPPDVLAEAMARYPDPTDVETGRPMDDWGYTEVERNGYAHGVMAERERGAGDIAYLRSIIHDELIGLPFDDDADRATVAAWMEEAVELRRTTPASDVQAEP